MGGLVGCDRDQRRETVQRIVRIGRQWLFEQVYAQVGQHRLETFDVGHRPALVRVDDHARAGGGVTHGADLRLGVGAIHLDLDERDVSQGLRGDRHRRGRIEADRHRGGRRRDRRDAEDIGHAAAREFRL